MGGVFPPAVCRAWRAHPGLVGSRLSFCSAGCRHCGQVGAEVPTPPCCLPMTHGHTSCYCRRTGHLQLSRGRYRRPDHMVAHRRGQGIGTRQQCNGCHQAAILCFFIYAVQNSSSPKTGHPSCRTASSGVWVGASLIFFAYIGFDAISTAAEECKRPERDLPIGIIGSLVICTVMYIAVALVLTGMVPWANSWALQIRWRLRLPMFMPIFPPALLRWGRSFR